MEKGAARKSAIQSFIVNLSVPGKRHNEASVQDFIALHYSPMHHDYPLIIRTFFCCQNIHILRSGREILVLCDLQNVRARYSVVQCGTVARMVMCFIMVVLSEIDN